MLELVLFGARLFVVRTPVAIALLAAAAIGVATCGTAIARVLKKRASRIDRGAAIAGVLFGLIALQLRETTSVPALGLFFALRWVAGLAIASASGALAFAASTALTRRRPLRLGAEAAIFELRDAIRRLDALALDARAGDAAPLIARRREALLVLQSSLERGVLSAACRAPLLEVLAKKPEPEQVPAHVRALEEARRAIEAERDGGAGSIAERIGVPAAELAGDALTAVGALLAAYEKLAAQQHASRLNTEAERQTAAALRLVPIPTEGTLSEGTLSERTGDLQLAEQMIAAADLTETITLALNAASTTTPLDRALTDAVEATKDLRESRAFRELLASLPK